MLKTNKRIYIQQPHLLSVSILIISLLVLYLIPTGPPIHAYANTFVNPKCRIFAQFFHNYKQLYVQNANLFCPRSGLPLFCSVFTCKTAGWTTWKACYSLWFNEMKISAAWLSCSARSYSSATSVSLDRVDRLHGLALGVPTDQFSQEPIGGLEINAPNIFHRLSVTFNS